MGQKLVFISNAETSQNVSILSFSYFLPISYRERGKESERVCPEWVGQLAFSL